MKIEYKSVDDYIRSFPEDMQVLLEKVRAKIKETAPDAIECIAYGMPAFKTFGKPLVYFGAFKTHIGFYATPTGHKEFTTELSKYKQGKGSVQFPTGKPIPFDLIEQIVAFRVNENLLNSQKKKKITKMDL